MFFSPRMSVLGLYLFFIMDWISPSIQAIGSIVGGLFGKKGSDSAAKTQYKIAQETNAMNYKIAQENNAFNERMVDKMNEFNSAVNQRKRLEEAGLNPYLMMDGGSAGTATTAPTADTTSVQHAPDVASSISQGSIALGSSISNAASQIASQVYNSKIMDANVRKVNADAASSEQDKLYKEIQNQFAAARFITDLRLKRMQGDLTKQEYLYAKNSMEDRLDAVKFQNTVLGSQASYYNQLSGLYDVQRKIEEANLKWLPKEKQAALSATLQNALTMASQMHLNYAQAKSALALAALNFANEQGVRLDNKLKDSVFDLSVGLVENQYEKGRAEAGQYLGGYNLSSPNALVYGVGTGTRQLNGKERTPFVPTPHRKAKRYKK